MERILRCMLAAALIGAAAYGHGGRLRGPNGGVPPGLREPSDPEPPPPPPSDPGDPAPTPTPPDDGAPPTPPEGGAPTPGTPRDGGAPPGPAPDPSGGRRGGARTPARGFENWQFWWAYNCDDIVRVRGFREALPLTATSPLVAGSATGDRAHPFRPTVAAIERTVRPALLALVHDREESDDVKGGAMLALARCGGRAALPTIADAALLRMRDARGAPLALGPQALESAVLALGLLRDLDAGEEAVVRRTCLEVLGDPARRTRERAWAAVALGLRGDREAVPALLARLAERHADDNLPAGVLCGVGLAGDPAPVPELVAALRGRAFRGQPISDRTHAFVAYALAKIADASALDPLIEILRSRRAGVMAKRSAALALGPVAGAADDAGKERARRALRAAVDALPDATARNFATASLGRIGTPACLELLLEYLDRGDQAQRPFAALALAVRVRYADRDGGAGLPAALRRRIVERLAEASERSKDTDGRAALLLARGLVKDASARDTLVDLAATRARDPMLRGYACVALGLLDDAGESAKEALRTALLERSHAELRQSAAVGLGLLRDARVVDLLVRELASARNLAVQGHIILALGAVGDHRAIQPLVDLLADPRAQTRAMAAVGLGLVADLEPLPALARLSKDYNWRASVRDLDELLAIY